MIQRLKKLITVLSFGFALAMPAMSLATVHAATDDCLKDTGGTIAGCLGNGVDKTDPDRADKGTPSERVDKVIRLVINVFSLVVGVIAVIMIIIGGLKYITSGGDSGNITGAKNTILYAIIGLVVVALAQIVVKFVLTKVTGQE